MALRLVVAPAFELHEGRGELGGEGRMALGDPGHRVALRGDHEGLDRLGQAVPHPASVHQFV
jgi:hypothetical protein